MKAYTNSAIALSFVSLSASLLLAQVGNAQNSPPSQAQQQAAAKPLRVVNRIAAIVNGRPITSSEVRARLAPIARELNMLHPSGGTDFIKALVAAKNHIIQELIERELVMFEFVNKGYMIPEASIMEEVNNRILLRFGGDRDKFIQGLRQSGRSFAEFKRNIRKEMSVSAIRSSKYEYGVPPTPDELRDEYNRTKRNYRDITKDCVMFEKIYIPMGAGNANISPEQQLMLAQQIANNLRVGEMKFSDAAKQYSQDVHAENGGKWPKMARLDLAVEFASIVFDAEIGKIIGPLFDSNGFTIVKVNRHIESSPPALSDEKVKLMVESSVSRTKSELRYRAWIKELRKHAVIRVFI